MPKKTAPLIEDLKKKIAIAEDAVNQVTNESLKAIAFQTVLQQLLASSEMQSTPKEKSDDVTRAEKPKERMRTKHPKGPKGRIEELIEEGFFNEKRTIGDVKKGLENHGWFHKLEDLNPSLLRLLNEKKLRRIKEPENEMGKLIWRYSKW